jgi:hypothetical protein
MTSRVAILIAVVLVTTAPVSPAAAYTTGGSDSGHEFIFNRVERILRNDGYSRYADWTKNNLSHLKDGSYKADHSADLFGIPFSASNHYMDRWGNGLFYMFMAAGDLADLFVEAAFVAWYSGDRNAAATLLGAVCHLVQDATVPHHACLTPWDWHSQYESKFDTYTDKDSLDNPTALTALSGGHYNWDWRWWRYPWDRVQQCADYSDGYLKYVNGLNHEWYRWWETDDDPWKVAKEMSPYAQRETAGLIAWFLWMVGY